MPSKNPQRLLSAAAICYRRLLALYPKPFREEFGGEMTLLFREQCRDALCSGGAWAYFAFLLRALLDLARSSVIERIQSLTPAISMKSLLASPSRAALFKTTAFAALAGGIILAFFLASLRPVYTAIARIEVTAPSHLSHAGFLETQMAMIQSQAVLHPFIQKIHLSRIFQREHDLKGELTTPESYSLLRKNLSVRRHRETSLLEIRTSARDGNTAALLANGIADAYREFALTEGLAAAVHIIDPAERSPRPARPNFVLLAVIVAGTALAAACFGLGLYLGRRSRSRRPGGPSGPAAVCEPVGV